MNKERLWTKDFVTVALVNFSLCMIFYLLMVVTAPYAVDTFGASTGVAGFVSGVFILGILVGRLGSGRIIEDAGHKRILITGSVLFAATSVPYLFTESLLFLVAIRLLHGIAFGIASNATGTIVAHIIPHHRRGEGISYYTMSTITAAALGPFAGILLMQHTDFRTIFMVTAIAPVISLAIAFAVAEPSREKPSPREEAQRVKGIRASDYLEFKALPISAIILVIGTIYSSLLIFLSLYTRHLHLEGAASFFFPVYSATVLISRPFSGRLLDAKGANFVVYPSLCLFAAGMLLFSQVRGPLSLLLAAVVIGLGYGNFLSIAQGIAIKVVAPHRLGLATSTFFICLDLGFGVGPYILGSLVPLTGYRGLYVLMVIMIVATMGLYHGLHGRKVREGITGTE